MILPTPEDYGPLLSLWRFQVACEALILAYCNTLGMRGVIKMKRENKTYNDEHDVVTRL